MTSFWDLTLDLVRRESLFAGGVASRGDEPNETPIAFELGPETMSILESILRTNKLETPFLLPPVSCRTLANSFGIEPTMLPRLGRRLEYNANWCSEGVARRRIHPGPTLF